MLEKTNSLLQTILKFFILVFFLIFMVYFSKSEAGSGDELVFLKDLELLKINWFKAISSEIGLTYLPLAYIFSFFLKDYIALRVVNILLFVFLYIYFKKIGEIKNKMFDFYFLFFSASGWFMLGTNDTLFIVSLTIFFNEVYKILENKEKTNHNLLLCSLIIAFFTRELIYIYIPIIIFSFILIHKKRVNVFLNIKIPLLLLCFFVILNIPSLINNHSFSYDNKKPPITARSNWSQRQYLAQLMVNNGQLENHQHPSWDQTDAYLNKNGANSLPNGLISGMLFDVKLTIKEFFKDFADVIFQSIRQTGFVVFINLCLLFYFIYTKKTLDFIFLPLATFVMISIFSLIIISYVESRWLIPLYIMSFVYFSDLELNNKLHKLVPLFNSITLILVIIYGTFRVWNKL